MTLPSVGALDLRFALSDEVERRQQPYCRRANAFLADKSHSARPLCLEDGIIRNDGNSIRTKSLCNLRAGIGIPSKCRHVKSNPTSGMPAQAARSAFHPSWSSPLYDAQACSTSRATPSAIHIHIPDSGLDIIISSATQHCEHRNKLGIAF